MAGELKVFGGRSHPALVQEICDVLNLEPGRSSSFNFSDGETFCQIEENVRGSDVYIVQPTSNPVNDNLMELLILLDSFKRSSASRVTAVMPYYGYARQDKKDKPRVPITAKLVADLISKAGADRVLTMDLHADQIQGFFDVPVDHLFAAPVLLDAIREMHIPDLVIVSPDAGGVERARAIAKRLGVGLAILDKRRTAPNEAEVMHVIGDVDGCNALIVDDIIDTAGTHDQGGGRPQEEGGRTRPGRRRPRRPVRPGAAAHQRVTPGAGAHHEHHAPGRQAGPLAEAEAPFGRTPAGRGDPPDPREQLRELSVRLETR